MNARQREDDDFENSDLTSEEKARVRHEVDYFVRVIEQRHSVRLSDAVEAIKWFKTRREFLDRLRSTTVVAIITLVTTALGFVLWEGFKMALKTGG